MSTGESASRGKASRLAWGLCFSSRIGADVWGDQDVAGAERQRVAQHREEKKVSRRLGCPKGGQGSLVRIWSEQKKLNEGVGEGEQ